MRNVRESCADSVKCGSDLGKLMFGFLSMQLCATGGKSDVTNQKKTLQDYQKKKGR